MADTPTDYSSLLPKAGDTHHAEREKAELARRIARECLEVGNGQGLSACLSVMVAIATDTTSVRPRTRANTAKAFVELCLRASASGVKVAIQNNNGVPPPAGALPREFWQQTMATPDGRKMALAELSRALGVPAPLPMPASELPEPAPTVPEAPKRRTGKAAT